MLGFSVTRVPTPLPRRLPWLCPLSKMDVLLNNMEKVEIVKVAGSFFPSEFAKTSIFSEYSKERGRMPCSVPGSLI